MNNTTNTYNTAQNLDAASRIANAVLGSMLIGIVFMPLPGGYLGWFSVLPIVAIYPCLTSILGYSPIRAAINALARQVDQRWSHYFQMHNGFVGVSAH